MQGTVLVVDDEQANLDSISVVLTGDGANVLRAKTGAEALSTLRSERVGVVLTDLMMPGMSGQELLRAVRAIESDTQVVLMTAYGTVEAAVAAMKDGAYDFLVKPLKKQALLKTVSQAMEKHRLLRENKQLRARLAGAQQPIVGQSPSLRATLDIIRQAAPSSATVLLLGESGTGKELFARALHEHSPRASGPTARPFPRPSSRASCSVTSAAPSPARSSARKAASSGRRRARSSSTRWAS